MRACNPSSGVACPLKNSLAGELPINFLAQCRQSKRIYDNFSIVAGSLACCYPFLLAPAEKLDTKGSTVPFYSRLLFAGLCSAVTISKACQRRQEGDVQPESRKVSALVAYPFETPIAKVGRDGRVNRLEQLFAALIQLSFARKTTLRHDLRAAWRENRSR
jgi:hypothetical protein